MIDIDDNDEDGSCDCGGNDDDEWKLGIRLSESIICCSSCGIFLFSIDCSKFRRVGSIIWLYNFDDELSSVMWLMFISMSSR